MTLLELAQKRYSVRSYLDKPIEKEKLHHLLEVVRLAPSAVNYQPWHFIVVTDPEMIHKIAESYPREWFTKAPAVIVACGDHGRSWKRMDGKDHGDIDVAIAVTHITLAATELGLGSCWVCAFDAKRCHEILELPEYLETVALIPLGYPAEEKVPEKNRKSLESIVSFDHYNG